MIPSHLRLLVAICALAIGQGALAQSKPAAVDSAKRRDIVKLMQLSGAGDMGAQVAQQMIPALKQSMADVPEEFWTQFAAKIKADALIERLVPIYDRNLTASDIKQLIAFYESPIGKKLIQAQPKIMQESMEAGRQWGMEIAREAMREIEAKGYGKSSKDAKDSK